MRFPETHHRVAPVSKDGAAPWFETPRTTLRKLDRLNIAAPHHEAGRDRECIRLMPGITGHKHALARLPQLS